MPARRSSPKKRSKCNSRKKSKTCPKKSCSWVKTRKNSNGRRVKPHCKDNPKKGSKKVSPCRKKKRSPCKTSKKCNWVKTHKGRNGAKISGFCKGNPNKGISRRNPIPYIEPDDDSSSNSSSDSDDMGPFDHLPVALQPNDERNSHSNQFDHLPVDLQPTGRYNSGSDGNMNDVVNNTSIPSSANAMQQLMAQPYGLNPGNANALSPLAQYSLLQNLS